MMVRMRSSAKTPLWRPIDLWSGTNPAGLFLVGSRMGVMRRAMADFSGLHDESQDIKAAVCRALIVLVIGHESAAVVARQNLDRLEVLARKRLLARP